MFGIIDNGLEIKWHCYVKIKYPEIDYNTMLKSPGVKKHDEYNLLSNKNKITYICCIYIHM
jgi:hypothetical protein